MVTGTLNAMPQVTQRQLGRIAAAIGHAELRVIPKANAHFVVTCSCGYRSTKRNSRRLAAEAAIHHVETAIKAWVAAGSPAPKTDTPTQEPEERRRLQAV